MASFDSSKLPTSDPISVFRYCDRLYAVDLLRAAMVEFDFFTWVAGQESTSELEIGDHFGFAERPVDVMVTLFVANGYLARRGDRLEATDLAREFLVADSPYGMRPYYQSLSGRGKPPRGGLVICMRRC